MSLYFVAVQYLAYTYNYVKEWRKNPQLSLSCCLALLLPLNDFQGELRGLTGRNILKQQVQTGRVDMPSIAKTLKESGAVDITLEDHDANRQQEKESNEIVDEQGSSTLVQISTSELSRGKHDTKL